MGIKPSSYLKFILGRSPPRLGGSRRILSSLTGRTANYLGLLPRLSDTRSWAARGLRGMM